MDQAAQDMSAQLAKFKSSDADTLIITTAVEQLTLIFKQAAALGLKKQFITTGGSQNPDQLIEQAGAGCERHPAPGDLRAVGAGIDAGSGGHQGFIAEWKKRGFQFAGVTESFRGYDGIRTIAAAIQKAGKAEPEAIRAAMWKLDITGLNGKIKFTKSGPAGKESGQSIPTVYLIKIEDGKVVVPTSKHRRTTEAQGKRGLGSSAMDSFAALREPLRREEVFVCARVDATQSR